MKPTDRTSFRSGIAMLCISMAFFVPQALGQGHPADSAASRMDPADGFEVRLVASEPLVRQPVCVEFDDRGRLWVIQYLQYPNPEGLQRVTVDRYSRTEYDRIPKPPPHGPRGADRITILSDTNNDGEMDSGRDFVNGLNLTSGLAFGHGGVFVLNVPYLLFYPDKDRDDVPDSEPRVLLQGFGMEDAHSVANSLTWGPDGWLYGCQGSTVTAKIRGIEFQQGVWRYHVESDRFELFCEGGGNAWGLDFDRHGNLLYSTNYGGYVLVHGVQGGYYVKSFSKHGALHNAHAYGYFSHAPHKAFQGGHVTVGGLVYQGGAFPSEFTGRYIAGDLLGHGVNWHHLLEEGSTFRTAHGGSLLAANDTWFAPTDVVTGPDGALYIADWHDARTAHPDPDADWDRSNGRIFRLSWSDRPTKKNAAAGITTPQNAVVDYSTLTTEQLLERHRHPNQWHVRRARQELVRRQATESIAPLRQALQNATDEQTALEALWSIACLNGVQEPYAEHWLGSPFAAVRSWTLRLLGDGGEISDRLAHRLDRFAEQEPDVRVRQQLACTARRLPARQAVPIINANINRDIDNDDPFLPLLWWWAIEEHCLRGRDEVIRRFVRPTAWASNLGREVLLPRLVRRYAAAATDADFDSIESLVGSAPEALRNECWNWIRTGLPRGSVDVLRRLRQHELFGRVETAWSEQPQNPELRSLAILLGIESANHSAIIDAIDLRLATEDRLRAIRDLRSAPGSVLTEPLLSLVQSDPSEQIQVAAVVTLEAIGDPQNGSQLIAQYMSASNTLKSSIRQSLLRRESTAREWLLAVDSGRISASETPLEQIRQVATFNSQELDRLVARHWGRVAAASREEKLAEVRRLNNDLRAGPGDRQRGQTLFRRHCANCHQLFDDGKKVGRSLTSANRTDRQALLINLVDPSSVIRKEYVSLIVQMTDGRVLTGLPVERTDSQLTLSDSQGRSTTIRIADVEDVTESAVSLMPENLYRDLSPQDLRDLFSWLQSNGDK